jgi:RNAse (barnase) inhibitor barstar
MAEIAYETVHEDLVAAVPEFRPVLEEHLVDQDGAVLPHVLFSDLTRFVLSARQRGDDEDVARSLAFLERAAHSDDSRVRNLVGVSFVENIGVWDVAVSAFIGDWPPHLQDVARSCGWVPLPRRPGNFVWIRHEFPWLDVGFIHAVHESALRHLQTRLRELGFVLTELEGSTMAAGRDAFFGDLEFAFGFPEHFGRNWDAVNDCMRDFEPPPRLAVIWRASDEAARANPALFGEACAQLRRWVEAFRAESVQIELFLIGLSDSYRSPKSVERY